MTELILGPLLRYVDETAATVWVETDEPCEVEVLGNRDRTFRVEGHNYALVCLRDLKPGSSYQYEVKLDGEPPRGADREGRRREVGAERRPRTRPDGGGVPAPGPLAARGGADVRQPVRDAGDRRRPSRGQDRADGPGRLGA